MAGIAAMVLTGLLGTAMGLSNTATFMASCVAFVAVALWTDSRIALRRRERAREIASRIARETAHETSPGAAQDAGSARDAVRAADCDDDRRP